MDVRFINWAWAHALRIDEQFDDYGVPSGVAWAVFEVLLRHEEPTYIDTSVDRWRELHGGGVPLCICVHDPPCDACQRSIEKYGCSCQEVKHD